MAEDDQRNRSVKALRILAYVLVVLILLGVIWLIVSGPKRTLPFLDLSARAERAEMRRKTHAFSIDSPEGKIEVLDIRTGSEFLRLITMPNGTTVAAGYGSIGVLHSDGAFEVFGAIHVVSVGVGVHPVETERLKELKERATKPQGRET